MGRLLEMLKGIARNTIALAVTIVAFATAGTVGTVLFHGKPAATTGPADEPAMDAGSSTPRHIASMPRKPSLAPKMPAAGFVNGSPSSSASSESPPSDGAAPAPESSGNSAEPAVPIGASIPQMPQSRSPAAAPGAEAAAANAATSASSTSDSTSTDSSGGDGGDGTPDTGFSSTATSTYTSPYVDVLSFQSMTPTSSLWLGGTTVTILGSDFIDDTPSVMIDSGTCSNVTVLNDGYLTCVVPSDSVGTVSVTLGDSSQTFTMTNTYTYTDVSTVTTLAGSSGSYGAVPSGASTASETAVRFENAVDVVASGSLVYVADTAHGGTTNNVIQQVNLSNGAVNVLVGNGQAGAPGSSTSTGTNAQLDTISALDLYGTNLYYSTCGVSSTVRLVDLTSNAVSNIMGDPTGTHNSWADGNGTSAYANCVGGLAHDSNYIYFVDAKNYVIREVTQSSPYTVTTIAGTEGTQGSADGTGTSATFYQPWGLTILNGYLYIGDGQAIRALNLSTLQVTTLAGSTTSSGFTDGTGTAARFYMTSTGTNGGLIRAMGGTIFIADQNNNAIRMMTTSGVVSTIFGSSASDTDGSIGSAMTNAPASVFYLPGTGIFFPNATTLRYFY